MKTILDIILLSTDFLLKKGIQNPRRQAHELIGDALQLKPVDLYLSFDRPLTELELTLCRERLSRRVKGEPSAYIHGEVEFHDCQLKITPAVLIPRQETEILVDKIIRRIQEEEHAGNILWDICCGSGCMGIAVKKHCPALNVTLADLSGEAFAIALDNAKRNNVEVEGVKGDLLAPFAGKKAHYVICNPPYISEEEYVSLDREVRDYEPRMALVGGPTGLEFYERLADLLPTMLLPGGKVWLEIGAGQGNALTELFQGGPWKTVKSEQDWAGLDRFFFLEIE